MGCHFLLQEEKLRWSQLERHLICGTWIKGIWTWVLNEMGSHWSILIQGVIGLTYVLKGIIWIAVWRLHRGTRPAARKSFWRLPGAHSGASQVVLVVKNLSASAGDARVSGSVLGLGRWPEVRNGNLLPYSCLENFTDGGARVHGVAKSWTWLINFTLTFKPVAAWCHAKMAYRVLNNADDVSVSCHPCAIRHNYS